MTAKRCLALTLSVLLILLTVCSCDNGGKKSKTAVPEFDFTIEEYIKRFNVAVGTLPEIEEVEEIQYTENSLFIQYVFEDQLCFGAYVNPKTRNVQKVFMWLRPDGIEDRAAAYKFGGYNTVLLSTMLSNEEDHKKAIETLKLDSDLELNSDTLYQNKDFAAYYSYDALGYRLLIMTVDEMREIEAGSNPIDKNK